jgi:hypothetical protein
LYNVKVVFDPNLSSAFHTEMSAFLSALMGETFNTASFLTLFLTYLNEFNTTMKVKINSSQPITASAVTEVEAWEHHDSARIKNSSGEQGKYDHYEWCNTTSTYHEESVWGEIFFYHNETSTYLYPGPWMADWLNDSWNDPSLPPFMTPPSPDAEYMLGNMSNPEGMDWSRMPISTWRSNWTKGEQICGRKERIEVPYGNESWCEFNWSREEDRGDYDPPFPPGAFPDVFQGPAGLFIVPVGPNGFDLRDFYDFGASMYEYDYNYWHTPKTASDGDGDGDSGPGMWCGEIPLEQPPTIEQMFEYAGIQNVIVEPLKATVSWKFYAMDKFFRNCFEIMNMGSVTNMDGRAAAGIKWNAGDGALDWFKICADLKADVDTTQLEVCDTPYPDSPCIPPPDPPGTSLPVVQEEIKFHLELSLCRQGIPEPNCSSLYGPDVKKKEGLKDPNPDDVMVFFVPDGSCVTRPLWTAAGVELRLKVCDEAGDGSGSNVTMAYWPENPSEGGKSPGFASDDDAIYFAIDVEGELTGPVELELDLPGSIPSSLVGSSADVIADAIKLVIWDDSVDNWRDLTSSDFEVTYNSTSNTITVKIHNCCSVFAVGFDEESLFMIPSYSPAMLVVALFGAAALIMFRTKRR